MPGSFAGFSFAWALLFLGLAASPGLSTSPTQDKFSIPKISAFPLLKIVQKLGWVGVRFLQDIVAPSPLPIAIPVDFPWQVGKARFWEMVEVTHFDHLLFPKDNHKLETFFYLLKMKLAGGASIFTIRDPKDSHKLIGTVYLRQLRQPGVGFISNVAVHEDYRRQGIAEFMMLQLALPEVQKRGFGRLVLNVVSDSFVQRFYEKLGFKLYQGNQFEIHIPEGESPMDMNLI